jgi:hypothetical protein
MKKFLLNGTFISVLFSVFGLIKTTMTGKRDWKLVLLWASWVLSLIAVIATITSLTNLTIYDARIDDASALEPLASLTDLSLRGNAYLDEGVEALGRMSALTAIDLRCTMVPPGDLLHLRNVTSLSYSNEGDHVSAQLSDFCIPRLSTLSLLGVDVSGWSHIPTLTSLRLCDCTTTRETRESLGRLTSLTRLDVCMCHDFDEDALLLMPLSLTDLAVPNFPRDGIARLTNLVSLNLEVSFYRMIMWPLSLIADSVPAGLRSLTLKGWPADHVGEAVESAVTLPSLASLSIEKMFGCNLAELSADTLARLTAATHIASVTINGRAVDPS